MYSRGGQIRGCFNNINTDMDIKDILKNESSKYNKIQARIRGFTQIPNWFIDSKEYTIYEKMVFIIIRRHQINKETCWPSVATIAKKARCGKTTANKAIKGLIGKDKVEKIDDKKVRSNVYKTKI